MTKQMRVNVMVLVIGLLALSVAACATRTDDTSNVTTSSSPSNAAKSNVAPSMSDADRQFMTDAAQGGKTEVQLGYLAVQKAVSNDVKQFGQRMIDDHSQANNELMQLAANKTVTLPSELKSEQQETMNRLANLSGKEFDRAYMAEMLKDHKEDVAKFEQAANQATDPALKSWANKTLPTLRQHLEMATETANKVGVKQ